MKRKKFWLGVGIGILYLLVGLIMNGHYQFNPIMAFIGLAFVLFIGSSLGQDWSPPAWAVGIAATITIGGVLIVVLPKVF